MDTLDRAMRSQAAFMADEIENGLRFTRTAADLLDSQIRSICLDFADGARNLVKRLLPSASLSPEDRRRLAKDLQTLETALAELAPAQEP